jgi:hypothetical protein
MNYSTFFNLTVLIRLEIIYTVLMVLNDRFELDVFLKAFNSVEQNVGFFVLGSSKAGA